MPKTLLVAFAHPDDESFGTGGTLARYAAEGVAVHYACATRGEAGAAEAEHLQGFADPGEMRWAELECAAQILGLAGVHWLGYRDSGMPGSPDNQHPQAQINAPVEAVAGRLVKLMRELKPQVVMTFDPIGGYRHPDHIHIHRATVHAFHAAGDPAHYPEAGPAYAPQKLYFHVFSRRFLKLAMRLMPLLGGDPRRFGRNKDIDLVSLTEVEFPIHARINTREYVKVKDRASACHQSQLAGGPPSRGLFRLVRRIGEGQEHFMRAYPEWNGARPLETDLFEGVRVTT